MKAPSLELRDKVLLELESGEALLELEAPSLVAKAKASSLVLKAEALLLEPEAPLFELDALSLGPRCILLEGETEVPL